MPRPACAAAARLMWPGPPHAPASVGPTLLPTHPSMRPPAVLRQGCKALFPHMAELAARRPDIKILLIEGEENKVRPSWCVERH